MNTDVEFHIRQNYPWNKLPANVKQVPRSHRGCRCCGVVAVVVGGQTGVPVFCVCMCVCWVGGEGGGEPVNVTAELPLSLTAEGGGSCHGRTTL